MTPSWYGTDPRFVTEDRRLELLVEKFVPWPDPKPPAVRRLVAKWTPEPAKRLKIASKADV